MEGLKAAVLAGLRVAISSEWIFTSELESGQMQELLANWQIPPLDLWAVLPGRARHANPKRGRSSPSSRSSWLPHAMEGADLQRTSDGSH